MVLGFTQPLTEMSTSIISWGIGVRCLGLTTLPLSGVDCLEIWEPQPPENRSGKVVSLTHWQHLPP